MDRSTGLHRDEATARDMLKKAYVWMNFGYYERAMTACRTAARRADDPLVPETIRGAIMTASGRPVEAMRHLMELHRRHRDAILTALYLAEACFLAGRRRRAWKTLEALDDEALAESPWRDFAHQLQRVWNQLDELDDLPDPIRVPLGDSDRESNDQL